MHFYLFFNFPCGGESQAQQYKNMYETFFFQQKKNQFKNIDNKIAIELLVIYYETHSFIPHDCRIDKNKFMSNHS